MVGDPTGWPFETQNPKRQKPYWYVVTFTSLSMLFQYVGGPNPEQVAFREIESGPDETVETAVVEVVKFPSSIAPPTTTRIIIAFWRVVRGLNPDRVSVSNELTRLVLAFKHFAAPPAKWLIEVVTAAGLLTARRGIGITGTPGTGKKTIAVLLASRLELDLLDLNTVAKDATISKRRKTELVVDTDRLRSELLRRGTSGAVVSGHLLPEVLTARELGFVAVLRCEPLVLKRRLEARGYDPGKVTANVEAELIGSVLDAAVRAFGPKEVHEYDTTHARPAAIAKKVSEDYLMGAVQSRPWTDWTLGYDSPDKLRLLLRSA